MKLKYVDVLSYMLCEYVICSDLKTRCCNKYLIKEIKALWKSYTELERTGLEEEGYIKKSIRRTLL